MRVLKMYTLLTVLLLTACTDGYSMYEPMEEVVTRAWFVSTRLCKSTTDTACQTSWKSYTLQGSALIQELTADLGIWRCGYMGLFEREGGKDAVAFWCDSTPSVRGTAQFAMYCSDADASTSVRLPDATPTSYAELLVKCSAMHQLP